MEIRMQVKHPDSSGLPGRAREILAEKIGWDEVRRLFPSPGGKRA